MCVVDLLKPLCKHMENMHNYFQVSGQQFWPKNLSNFVSCEDTFHFGWGKMSLFFSGFLNMEFIEMDSCTIIFAWNSV